VEETREHFLLECGGYREERKKLFEEVKKAGGRLEGGLNPDLLRTIFHPRFTFPLLRFVHSTGRFSSLFAPVISPSPSKAPLR
jgi:hypothetical protein